MCRSGPAWLEGRLGWAEEPGGQVAPAFEWYGSPALDYACPGWLAGWLAGWLQVLLLNYFGGSQNRKVAEMSDEELVEQVRRSCTASCTVY